MKQGIYIVVSENEIVKAEMEKPLERFPKGHINIEWDNHLASLPRIPIHGKHNWKVWQEVVEGRDVEFDLIDDGGWQGQWVAIPIEQTKSEGAKSELLSVNEAGAIAAKIAETVSPALSAHEQALFVAGFQECIKYLSQQNNLLTNDNPQTK